MAKVSLFTRVAKLTRRNYTFKICSPCSVNWAVFLRMLGVFFPLQNILEGFNKKKLANCFQRWERKISLGFHFKMIREWRDNLPLLLPPHQFHPPLGTPLCCQPSPPLSLINYCPRKTQRLQIAGPKHWLLPATSQPQHPSQQLAKCPLLQPQVVRMSARPSAWKDPAQEKKWELDPIYFIYLRSRGEGGVGGEAAKISHFDNSSTSELLLPSHFRW